MLGNVWAKMELYQINNTFSITLDSPGANISVMFIIMCISNRASMLTLTLAF